MNTISIVVEPIFSAIEPGQLVVVEDVSLEFVGGGTITNTL